MARTVTLAELRAQARQLSDTESDPHISDAEVDTRINTYVQRLWNRILATDPDRCTVVTSIVTTTGTLAYNLPEDFVAIRAVDLIFGPDRIMVGAWVQQNRWRHRFTSGYLPALGDTDVVYRIMGQEVDGTEAQIHFLPDPGDNTYEIRYVQAAPALVNDLDPVDGIAGFEQWIAYRAARDLLRKQKRYEGDFERDIQELEHEIRNVLTNRDAAEAPQIANTRSRRRYPLIAR